MNLKPLRIILIRHGQAEPLKSGETDDQRQLTPQGEQELRLTALNLEPLLRGSSVRLWSSPLIRARQSAAILTGNLNLEPEAKDCLAKADLESFLKEAESLDSGTTLIAIGHEPALSRWILALSGIALKLTTGSAVILDRVLRQPHPFIVAHWSDPSAQRVDSDRRKPALETLKGRMRGQLQLVFTELDSFRTNPSDPETAHQVRVSLRTLASLVIFAKPLCEKSARSEALDRTMALAEHWSALRSLDVFIGHYLAFRALVPKTTGHSGLLRILKARRLKLRNRLISMLNRGETVPELFAILAWIDSLENPDQPSLEKFAQARFDSLNRKAFRKLGQLDPTDLEAVHELRLRLKTLRYLAEGLDFLHLTNKEELRELTRLQAELGKICDWRQDLLVLTENSDLFRDERFSREADLFTGYLLGCLEQYREL